jgi:hypothetical protein
LAAALLGLLLSQPGHALVYLIQFGSRGLALETQGVHGYFPVLLRMSWALTGLVVVGGLALIAVGRIVFGHALGRRRLPGVGPGRLFLVLAIVQLTFFFAQESIEAGASGTVLHLHGYLAILGFGALGQLPLSVLGALALSWLSSPLQAAISALRSPFVAVRRLVPDPVPAVAPAIWSVQLQPVRLEATYPPAFRKRGPPLHLRSQSL